MKKKNVFFTGPPRCGKTTLIQKVVEHLDRHTTGFFSKEIREKGHRTGFSIETLDGKKGILAHVDIKGRCQVGKYGVNLKDIDLIAVPSILPKHQSEIVVIDEVGKMECFSALFRKTLVQILDSDHVVIGSISLKGDAFIKTIKSRKDVEIIHVTHGNRNELAKIRFSR
jgi:nucleoside-triphosphatase